MRVEWKEGVCSVNELKVQMVKLQNSSEFIIFIFYSVDIDSSVLSDIILATFLGSFSNVLGHCISDQLIGTIGIGI